MCHRGPLDQPPPYWPVLVAGEVASPARSVIGSSPPGGEERGGEGGGRGGRGGVGVSWRVQVYLSKVCPCHTVQNPLTMSAIHHHESGQLRHKHVEADYKQCAC